jgi:dynein heavy chain
MGEDKSIKILRISDPMFLRTLELSIKNGYWMLIEDMPETTDPALEPLLLNQTTKNSQGK